MQSMISVPSLKLDRRNVRTSFLYDYEPSSDCTYVQNWKISTLGLKPKAGVRWILTK